MYFRLFNSIYYGFNIGNNYVVKPMTDITTNVRLFRKTLEEVAAYDIYTINDYDTPEIISYNLYGTSMYHWTVMLANETFDNQIDWPMNSNLLRDYMIDKYNRFEATSWTYNGNEVTVTIPGHNITISSPEDVTVENMFVIINDIKQNIPSLQGTIRLMSSDPQNQTVTLKAKGAVIGTPIPGFTLYTSNREFSTIHHYEKNGFVVDESEPGASPVYCYEYESAVNESKRNIKVISPTLIKQIVDQFQQSFVQ